MAGYDFAKIEKTWQQYWARNSTFRQPNPGEEGFADRPKFYVLDMFPYPSGAGLHVGHPEGYTATDIVARYKRMRGFNVLHPMGYDAFGLPAEQYAVEHGIHPRVTTARNIDNIERQIRMLGFSYDWSRRLATTDPDYYRWTQWIFLKMFNSWYDPAADAARPISELIRRLESGDYVVHPAGQAVVNFYDGMTAYFGQPMGTIKWHELPTEQRREIIDNHRLAYIAEVPVNWCPKLGTVLANEEVTNEGRSDRGDHPVYRRALRQWMLRITAYADRLLADLDMVDWPEPIKIMQRNWIGKSIGAEVDFPLEETGTYDWFYERKETGFPAVEDDQTIRVYTTRPDTLFGATYMVLAPEHPLVERITTDEQRADVRAYVTEAARKSELERMTETREKTGVFTGAYAVNPVNHQQVPVWIADYVMMGYGTGAIMAVPAHDTRDLQFAKKFGLAIRVCVLNYGIAQNPGMAEVYQEHFASDHWTSIVYLDMRGGKLSRQEVLAAAHRARLDESDIRVIPVQGERVVVLYSKHAQHQRIVHFQSIVGLSMAFGTGLDAAFEGDGVAVNSGQFDGLQTPEFKTRITKDLISDGLGRAAVNYKLRDWLFSRQRYWGEPFPIVHCDKCGAVALPDEQLPLELPEMDDFTPAVSDDPEAPPSPPLGKAADWGRTVCPACGSPARRELNTMPQWAGSCWYYLRFLDPKNPKRFCNPDVERYWMCPESTTAVSAVGAAAADTGETPVVPRGGIDLYVGGAEHAVLHLLYARFWHKVLYDLRHVSTPEPFGKLFNQGMIRSFAYRDSRGVYASYGDVDLSGEKPRHKTTGEELSESVEKMSKSLKNVVNPDDAIAQYGADTFRLYEMFMGPLEASKPWNTRDVPGVHRFLNRVWRMIVGDEDHRALLTGGTGSQPKKAVPPNEVEKALHKLTQKVGEDIESMKFNTAIAAMMEFVNAVFKAGGITPDQAGRFVLLLSPFAPHVAEELWRRLGHDDTLAYESFPSYDEAMIVEQTVELAVQVNGKIRGRITISADASQDDCIAAALAEPKVAAAVEGKDIVKRIVVPGRLVNLVVK